MRRGFGAANTVATRGGRAYLTQQTQGPFKGHLSFFPFISRETFAVLGGNDPGEFAVKETDSGLGSPFLWAGSTWAFVICSQCNSKRKRCLKN